SGPRAPLALVSGIHAAAAATPAAPAIPIAWRRVVSSPKPRFSMGCPVTASSARAYAPRGIPVTYPASQRWTSLLEQSFGSPARGGGRPADRYHALVQVHVQEPRLVVGRAPDTDGLAERDRVMAEFGQPRVDASRPGVSFSDRRFRRDVQRQVRGGHLYRLSACAHLAAPGKHHGSLV